MGQVLEDLDILHGALPSCREQPNTRCVPADESFEPRRSDECAYISRRFPHPLYPFYQKRKSLTDG